MSAAHAASAASGIQALRARVGPVSAPLGVRAFFGLLLAIGAVTFAMEYLADPTRAFAAFLLAYWYFLGLGLAGAFFTAIQHITGATWSVAVRRVAESLMSYLPIAMILLLVLFLGVPHIYVWASGAAHEGGHHGADLTKGGYLSTPLFALRAVVILGLWCAFAWYFLRNSIRQDKTGDPSLTRANVKAAPLFILLFALTVTLLSFDFLMSLEPAWYSTIFGVYCFAGFWQAGLATIAILVVLLRRQGALQGVVNRFHYWDLGKFLFAFSVFWMYIAFSQFMLIWYANLPEETEWLIHRTYTGWGGVGIALGILRFVIPFFALMHQRMKESETVLLVVGGGVLIGQWIDLYWLILPAFSPEAVVLGWTEIGVTLGFLGLFGLTVTRFFAKNAVAAHGDPLFEASVRFHG